MQSALDGLPSSGIQADWQQNNHDVLANNIAFMYTNVASPLCWNFCQDTIPEVLKGAPQFRIDNPVALQEKYFKLKDGPI